MTPNEAEYYNTLALNLERGTQNKMTLREAAAAIRAFVNSTRWHKAQLDATTRSLDKATREATEAREHMVAARTVDLEGMGMRRQMPHSTLSRVASPTSPMPTPAAPRPTVKPGLRRFTR